MTARRYLICASLLLIAIFAGANLLGQSWLGGVRADFTGNKLYTKIIRAHNNRVGSLKRLWARAVVEARWTEDNGRKRFEQGDGHLILSFPDKSALTVGKLGEIMFWAGASGREYWLFDQQAKLLHIGRTDAPQIGRTLHRSPLLVRPSDIPHLIGVLPLPELPAKSTGQIHARQQGDLIIIEPPGQQIRLFFNARTHRPTRIVILNKKRQTLVTAELTNFKRMEKQNSAIGPYIPTTINIHVADRMGRLTVYLTDATNAEEKVKTKLFNLDFLHGYLKPERIINLDKPPTTHH